VLLSHQDNITKVELVLVEVSGKVDLVVAVSFKLPVVRDTKLSTNIVSTKKADKQSRTTAH